MIAIIFIKYYTNWPQRHNWGPFDSAIPIMVYGLLKNLVLQTMKILRWKKRGGWESKKAFSSSGLFSKEGNYIEMFPKSFGYQSPSYKTIF